MKKRALFLLAVLITGLLSMGARIFYVSQFMLTRADAVKSSRAEFFGTDRALIFDCNGEKLVETQPCVSSASFADNVHFSYYKRYSSFALCPHITGYLNAEKNGVTGIEKDYNSFFRSVKNHISVTYNVDASGRVLSGTAGSVDSSSLCTDTGVELCIDKTIQTAVQNFGASLGKGAVVVMDAGTGDVKAMASFPSFDPAAPENSIGNGDEPFLNRALCTYSVGSVFKTVVCMAALENGVRSSYSYKCKGYEMCGGKRFNCHKEKGHGTLNMKTALAYSCNTYFINLARKTGYKRILESARMLGVENSIKLSESIIASGGNLPDEKALTSPAGLANFSFGQGELLATPLEICKIYSVIASGGIMREPRLVKGVVKGGELSENRPFAPKRVISSETAALISDFLRYTVSDGTGAGAAVKNRQIAGKTATAQTGKYTGKDEILISYFAGFFTVGNTAYTAVVMKQGGSSGSKDCAPVFKSIAESVYKAYKK